jgi:membrane-associated phospholipid phosphatase
VRIDAVARADLRLFRSIRGAARPPAPVGAVTRFSSLGEHAAVWLALGAGGAALDPARRPRWLRALGGVGVAYVLNVLTKLAVRRKRPVQADLPALVPTPTKLSFPSSHATSSFAAARAYSALVPAGPLYAVATAMALSRVFLGVHYPSDIAGGAALGTLVGSAARR